MEYLIKKVQQKGLKVSLLTILRKILLIWFSLLQRFHAPYFFRKIFFGYAIKEVNGFKMFLDLKNDVGISKDLFIFGKREHLSTDYMLSGEVLKLGDAVLDLGANIGYYALIESRLVGKNGRVYALEPVQNNFKMLQKNVELNNISNMRTFNLAAGSENEVGEIHVAHKGNVSSFVYDKNIAYKKKEKIQVVKVDDFVTEHNIKPALVRMDVQGFEKEIIKGMEKTLLGRPKLFIEVHPFLMKEEELIEMFEAIKKSGYNNAVVMKTRKAVWMNKKGEVRPFLKFLTRKIEGSDYTLGVGRIDNMTLESLQKSLIKNPKRGGFIVFLS